MRKIIFGILGLVLLLGLSFGGGYLVGRRSGISPETHRKLTENLKELERHYTAASELADERGEIIRRLTEVRDDLESANNQQSGELEHIRGELGKLSDYLREREELIADLEIDNAGLRENLTAAREAILRYLGG